MKNNFNRGFDGQNFRNRQNFNRTMPAVLPKRSGATFTIIPSTRMVDGREVPNKSKGMTAISAWMKTKQGLVTINAVGYDRVKGKNCQFEKAVAEVRIGVNLSKYPVLINITTKRCIIKELNLMITAKGSGVTSTGKRVNGAVLTLKF